MKGVRIVVFFLVLSASLMCTTEAARSRTSSQNSFRRAASGIYQTLSSVFGEDNIRGFYKVSVGPALSVYLLTSAGACRKEAAKAVLWSTANRKQARPGLVSSFTDAILKN